MAKAKLDTSISDSAANTFLKDSADRATLWCEKVTGLHLLKTKTGGSWRYRYTDPRGKRKTATVGRYPAMKPQQAAEKAMGWRNDDVDVLAEKAEKKALAISQEQRAAHRTLKAYLDGPYTRYQSRRSAGDGTLAILRSNFENLLDRDMASLTRADIHTWQADKEKKGRAHATLKRAYGALRTLLKQAIVDGVLDENPLQHVSLEKPLDSERARELRERRESTRRLLTKDELAAFHNGLDAFSEEIRQGRRNSRKHGKPHLPDLDNVAFPHWFIPFAKLSLFTGMRPGDLYSLQWQSELNPTFGRLTKTPEKTKHHGEDKAARVEMDLPPQAMAVVKSWWEQNGKPDSGLVFPSPVTGKRMDKNAHDKPWRRVKRLGGLPDDLTLYALRHHFISSLVAAGVPLFAVAKLAGHKSVAMIESHYGHLCPDAAKDILREFGASVEQREAV
ncbi:integrase family protein [Marinobacter zhanjiangensis]|uniref:Recombinase n=1 Tax=Marinobacter zhanjiangensis TaxID=578215 RepID=A0ABQ3B9Y6_9GAMM|nr:integrase family protein [Marinobacter zhanjiangensis]GGY85357.1 recombinase [Marinobacter zhanjiangensis]